MVHILSFLNLFDEIKVRKIDNLEHYIVEKVGYKMFHFISDRITP